MFNEKHEQLLPALADSYVPVPRPVCADEPVSLCPVCHDEYVHPVVVRVVPARRSPGLAPAGLPQTATLSPESVALYNCCCSPQQRSSRAGATPGTPVINRPLAL